MHSVGEVNVAPAGSACTAWNAGDDEVHVLVGFRPALRTERAFETLEEPLAWNNSTLINGDEFAEEIIDLKRRPGKDITIIGSGALVGSLLGRGLLDELRLMVHPVILGGGKRLFEEGVDWEVLKLVDSRMFTTGVVYLTYRPADER